MFPCIHVKLAAVTKLFVSTNAEPSHSPGALTFVTFTMICDFASNVNKLERIKLKNKILFIIKILCLDDPKLRKVAYKSLCIA